MLVRGLDKMTSLSSGVSSSSLSLLLAVDADLPTKSCSFFTWILPPEERGLCLGGDEESGEDL